MSNPDPSPLPQQSHTSIRSLSPYFGFDSLRTVVLEAGSWFLLGRCHLFSAPQQKFCLWTKVS